MNLTRKLLRLGKKHADLRGHIGEIVEARNPSWGNLVTLENRFREHLEVFPIGETSTVKAGRSEKVFDFRGDNKNLSVTLEATEQEAWVQIEGKTYTDASHAAQKVNAKMGAKDLNPPQRAARRQVNADAWSGSPDQWYLNEYMTPFKGDLGSTNNLPGSSGQGGFSLLNLKGLTKTRDPREKEPMKEVGPNKHTIEMVLNNSDLPAWRVEESLDLLPDLKEFYTFLREYGLTQQEMIIRSILDHRY